MWNNGDISNLVAKYTYPNDSNSPPKNLAINSSIWLTAIDSSGNLKCAAQSYRTLGFDFWPGPIQNDGPWVEDSVCSKFDRFFEVYKTEVCTHIDNINSLSLPLSVNTISTNIKEWPGKGNQYLLNTYGMHINEDLAPFYDSNSNGVYDPENGDYPLSKGDQSIFWVINDIGSTIHTNSGGDALGVEIQIMAYAYATNNAVNDATFYDYTIIKKTHGNLDDFYFSKYIDPEIGFFYDDFIGCDTFLNYGFTYDNQADDYAGYAPIFVTQNTKTPNNKGMSSFMECTLGNNPKTSFPTNATQYRNYQLGLWKDSSSLTTGGNGTGMGIPTKFIYPGNPGSDSINYWSECNNSNPNNLGDRRYIQSTGPYKLFQNQPLQFSFSAIVVPIITGSIYNYCPDKTTLINPVVNFVDHFLDTVNNIPCSILLQSAVIDISNSNNILNIYPNPVSEILHLDLDPSFDLSLIEIFDIKGAKQNAPIKGNEIDVSQFSKGIYSLKIYSKKLDKLLVKKFVVE